MYGMLSPVFNIPIPRVYLGHQSIYQYSSERITHVTSNSQCAASPGECHTFLLCQSYSMYIAAFVLPWPSLAKDVCE